MLQSQLELVKDRQTPNTLDYIFTDEEDLVKNIDFQSPLGKSDHVCMSFHYVLGEADHVETFEKLNFWKADNEQINEELSTVNWAAEFAHKSCNEMWETFCDKVHTLIQQHVLINTVKRNTKQKNHWMTKATLSD